MSNEKAERNAQAYEQITTILTASGKPMTLPDLHSHALFRPLTASSRSLAQWLKHLVKVGTLTKRGTGRKALYGLVTPRESKSRAHIRVHEAVVVTVRKDGAFHSVRVPAGIEVCVEIAA